MAAPLVCVGVYAPNREPVLMVEVEIPLCTLGDISSIGHAVSDAGDSLGLHVVSEHRLASYAGSRHWHLRKPGVSGTLEVTCWPDGGRFWISYHTNRIGDGWVVRLAPALAAAIRENLQGP